MVKGNVLSIFFVLVLVSVPICTAAADVAYLYRSSANVDENVLSVFEEIGLDVELVQEDDFPDDFSDYRAVFISDEKFRVPLPVYDKPTIFLNHYHGQEYGLVDNDGVSQLVSGQPLRVSIGDNSFPVYTSARGSDGKTLFYYFLDEFNKAPALQTLAGTYPIYSDKHGDVVSFASEGDVLFSGVSLKGDLCFFGATKSDYWTEKAYELFNECVLHVVEPLASNDTNSTGECFYNNDCDDGDSLTNDICINSGSNDSYCSFSAEGLPIFTFLNADKTTSSVTLRFSAVAGNDSLSIDEYAVRKGNEEWIVVDGENYTYTGLTSDTSYVFYVRASDSSGASSVLNMTVKTDAEAVNELASNDDGSYHGGSRGSGGCVTKWTCEDWSECEEGMQTRTCSYPENYCEPIYVRPIEKQTCLTELSQELSNDSLATSDESSEENKEIRTAPITGAVVGTTLRSPTFWIIAFLLVVIVLYVYVRSKTAGEVVMPVAKKKTGKKSKK